MPRSTQKPEPVEPDNAPPYPGIRLRPVRIDDELWAESKQTAQERGETVSGAIREFLVRYNRAHKRAKSRQATDE